MIKGERDMDFTTIEMLEALEQVKPVYSFFTSFFPNGKVHSTSQLQIDIKKGKRPLAPFCSPKVGGKVLKRQGFRTKLIDTPRIAPETILTIDDVEKRSIGENIYTTKTPEQREIELLAEDTKELESRIERTKNWLVREMIYNGKINVEDEEDGYSFEVDFGFTNKEVLAKGWDELDSDPISDLSRARLHCIQSAGFAPTIAILSGDVVDAFKNNEKVQKAMDIKNFNFASYTPKIVNDAITFLGVISELGLELYRYDDWFVDEHGKEQPFVPKGTVALLPKQMGSMEYGLVTQYEGEQKGFCSYLSNLVPLIYGTVEGNAKIYRLTSRPVPIPKNVDGWYILEGVTKEGGTV